MSTSDREESNTHSTLESTLNDMESKNEVGLFSWKSSERKKPLVPRSKDRTTNFVEFSLSRLHLSPGKRKPLIRKSKLKFLGSQMFNKKQLTTSTHPLQTTDDTSEASTHGPTCMLPRYKICLCNTNFIRKSIRPSLNIRTMFEKGKDLQDFRSLSLKEKWMNPDEANETVGNFDFVSRCTFRTKKASLKHKLVKKRLRDSELPDLNSLTLSDSESNTFSQIKFSCAKQARNNEEFNTDELAAYLDNYLHFPKKMSYMAEMMYT